MSNYTLEEFKALGKEETLAMIARFYESMDLLTLKAVMIVSLPPGFWKAEAEVVPDESKEDESKEDEMIQVAQEVVDEIVSDVVEQIAENLEPEKQYIHPPRMRDAEHFWPYMRCKNIAKELWRFRVPYNSLPKLPRSHYDLLNHLANELSMPLDTLIKTDPLEYFAKDRNIIRCIRGKYSKI